MHHLKRQPFRMAGHDILLDLPADPDALLASATDVDADCDPYWGILWDAAVPTAECVLQSTWADGLRVLEIGCGAGLVGLAGLLAGMDVTFSDMVPDAVQLAEHNAALNGFPNTAGIVMDWNDAKHDSFDMILASDVLYETRHHAALLTLLKRSLHRQGRCWIGDPGRQQAVPFIQAAIDNGWSVQLSDRNLQPIDAPVLATFQLIALTRTVTGEPE
ncbi:MAG: methyltransferase domain-containing protein [Planctomycetaceae bacterium]